MSRREWPKNGYYEQPIVMTRFQDDQDYPDVSYIVKLVSGQLAAIDRGKKRKWVHYRDVTLRAPWKHNSGKIKIFSYKSTVLICKMY